jgi:hypothetical protein
MNARASGPEIIDISVKNHCSARTLSTLRG